MSDSDSRKMQKKSVWKFFVLVFAIILGLAWENAFLTSWQQTGWTAISSAWANAGVLLGAALILICFKKMWDMSQGYS